MQIVSTIRPGHIIRTKAGDFLVGGSMKARSGYKYICTDARGRKVSLDRNDVLEAQREGSAQIVAA